jgi:hypothetical protein
MKFWNVIKKPVSNYIVKIKAAIPPIPVLISILVVLIIFSWFVTEGSWQFTAPLNLGYRQFFDYQAASILQGRLDVPPEIISNEAWVHDGKYFGYFGIGPSLLRIPLNAFFPFLFGRWNELFLTAGCIINLLAVYWIYQELSNNSPGNLLSPGARKRPAIKKQDLYISFLILVFGLGSTNIFISSHASIFHEPIMLGSAFSLLSCLFFIKFVRSPSLIPFFGMLFFVFFAFFTRAITGISVIPMIGLLLVILCVQKWLPFLSIKIKRYMSQIMRPVDAGTPQGSPSENARERLDYKLIPIADFLLVRYIAALFIFFFFVAGLYFWVNQTKFGTWIDDHSYNNYVLVKPDSERYKRTDGGKSFFIQNYPMMASIYFFPLDIQIVNKFPPFVTNQIDVASFPYAKWDAVELTDPVTLCMPFECILACVGLFSLARRKQSWFTFIPVFTSGLVIPIMLGFFAASQRYEHDFFPFFVLSGIVGYLYLTEVIFKKKTQVKSAVIVVFMLLGFISIYQSLAVTFNDQRNGHFLISANRITELKKITNDIDEGFMVSWRNVKKIIQPLRNP